jgi:hypothetical protein
MTPRWAVSLALPLVALSAGCPQDGALQWCVRVDRDFVGPGRVVEPLGVSGEDLAAEFATIDVDAVFTFDRVEDADRAEVRDPFTATLRRSGRPHVDTHNAVAEEACWEGPRLVVPVEGQVVSELGLDLEVSGTVTALGPGDNGVSIDLSGRSDVWPSWAGDVGHVCDNGATEPDEPREALFWLYGERDDGDAVRYSGALGGGIRNDVVNCGGSFASWTEPPSEEAAR